ncbi:hypothetical protein Tco_1184252 [Tanacetum coccineum]
MLLDMEKLIKANRTLLNSNIFPHEEISMRVLLAKERILKLIQVWDEEQIKPWSLPELLFQLFNDSQNITEILKQREEKRIEREQAANLAVQKEHEEQAAQSFTPYWNFPMIDDDDDEHTIQYRLYLERSSKAITPDLLTEEPDNSLSMGDEHLDTILKMELDEVIKSSVEDLVPILSELAPLAPIPTRINKAGFDQEEDIRCVEQLLNNSPPLDVLNDYFEIFSDSNDDYTSSDVDSFEDIDYVEASPPDFELVNLEEVEDIEPDQGELTSVIMDDIFERNEDKYFDPEGGEIDTSPNVNDNHYLPFTFVIRIFLPYLTYPKDSSLLLSCGNEDTIFDPGIFAYIFYSYKPVLSHRSGTFICFNVYLNILNESIMEICSSICFPLDQ